jgi:hypothetical protein
MSLESRGGRIHVSSVFYPNKFCVVAISIVYFIEVVVLFNIHNGSSSVVVVEVVIAIVVVEVLY